MTDRTGYINASVEGPRWAKLPEAIRNGVLELDLTLDSIDTEKRLLRETVYFKISGPESKLRIFQQALQEALEDYNGN